MKFVLEQLIYGSWMPSFVFTAGCTNHAKVKAEAWAERMNATYPGIDTDTVRVRRANKYENKLLETRVIDG